MPQHEQIGADGIAQQRGRQACGVQECGFTGAGLGLDADLHIVAGKFQAGIQGELPGDRLV